MPIDLLTLGAALLTGLLGSVHCVAMCGGIATGLASTAVKPGFAYALQLNLGRVAGYVLAGAIVGGFGGTLLSIARIAWLPQSLRMALGGVLIVLAARLLWPQKLGFLTRVGHALWTQLQPIQRRVVPASGRLRPWLLGAFWGWLPCGLSTTLLAAAWLEASMLHGALLMAFFGAGTLLAMVPLTWSGARLLSAFTHRGWRTAGAAVIASAGVLTLSAPWLMQQPALHSLLIALGCRSL